MNSIVDAVAGDLAAQRTRSSIAIVLSYSPPKSGSYHKNIDFMRKCLVKLICLSFTRDDPLQTQWLTFQTNPNCTAVDIALYYNVYNYVKPSLKSVDPPPFPAISAHANLNR